MKVSELIKDLKRYKNKYGDLEIEIISHDDNESKDNFQEIRFEYKNKMLLHCYKEMREKEKEMWLGIAGCSTLFPHRGDL